jgi:hypothetical protein
MASDLPSQSQTHPYPQAEIIAEPTEASRPVLAKPTQPSDKTPGSTTRSTLSTPLKENQTANRLDGTMAPVPDATPAAPSRRWKKRLLLIGTSLLILGVIFWATAERPVLLKQPDEVPSRFDASILEVAGRVDQAFDREIKANGLNGAGSASWNTVARRLSLAMVGNSLSLEEYRAIERIPEPERIAWWTEYLLQDRRWADYMSQRFSRATVGTNDGPFLLFRRRKYLTWLADQFQQNLPYDQLVRKLITAKGSWIDAPEVNFLTATMDEADKERPDAIRLAGRTSRAFLAMRIDCLQCHNDYLGNVKFKTNEDDDTTRTGEQSDFHQLAAFYSSVRMENAFSGLKDQSADYRYKYLNTDEETDVTPDVPFDRDLCSVTGGNRQSLAQWVTHPDNKAFSRAAVNRVWAIMTGKPLVVPIDDIPIDGPIPPGLELLADDFASHDFNIQRLIRIIAATQVFQRDSQTEAEELTDAHETYWSVFPLTQLRPEQMAASIQQACRLKAIDASSSIVSQLEMFGVVNDFTQAYGDRGDDEFQEQSVTIPQRLLVMNGQFISERINNNPIMNAATRIANLSSDDDKAIESAFISTLNRIPNEEERSHFAQRLLGTGGDARSRELSNLFWVLLNSSEFQWNH